MDLKVRFLQDEDIPFVNEILNEAFSYGRGEVTGEDFSELVAICDGKVAGYLLLTRVLNPIKNRYYYLVDYVCVSSSFRGQGIGKALLDKAYQVAKEGEGMYLQLTCSRFRVAAHKLYEKCNFMKRDSDIYRKEIL